MTKIKVNIQAPDRTKREVGILDTITDTIKCIKDRVFKRKDVIEKGIIEHETLKK